MASVLVSPRVQRQVDRRPKVVRARVWQLIQRLGKWPEISGAKPLHGNLAGRYRLRTGDYRLQFRIEGRDVVIEHIGHRAGFYDE